LNDEKENMTFIQRLLDEQCEGTEPKVRALDTEEKILNFVRRMDISTEARLVQDRVAQEGSLMAIRNQRVD
jgi:hypothetical protein